MKPNPHACSRESYSRQRIGQTTVRASNPSVGAIQPACLAIREHTMVMLINNVLSTIEQGLKEAVEFSKGKSQKAVIHEFGPLDAKIIQAKPGMSQSEFAVGISVSTLRHGERGDRSPQGPALVLLNIVAREPDHER